MVGRIVTGAGALLAALTAPAYAQGPSQADPLAPLQFDAGGRLILLGGAFDGGSAELVGLRLELEAGVETVLEQGLAIGARLAAVGERDHPSRSPRGGLAGVCPPGFADCAAVSGSAVRAPVSGYAGAELQEARGGPRAAVEQAYIYVDGGWGAVNLGLVPGAAAALSLPTPTILAGSSAVDGSLSLTGLGGVQTVNDLSGSSAKLVFRSVSLLGLSAGLSYGPGNDHRTVDQGFAHRAGEAVVFEAERIWEGGLRFERVWRSGLRTRAALTYLTGEGAGSEPQWGDIEAWSAGVQLGYGPLRGGVSVLESDNGWSAGERGYSALAASSVYEAGPWALMIEASSADDDLAHVQTDALLAAIGWDMGDGVTISLSLMSQDRSVPEADAFGRTQRQESAKGLMLEFAADL